MEFTLDAFGDQKFTGKVLSRNLVPIKDSNPISYNVTITVDPNEAEMLDGMSANATIVLKQQKTYYSFPTRLSLSTRASNTLR